MSDNAVNILVIESDKLFQNLLKDLLCLSGYGVYLETTCEAGLELTKNTSDDIDFIVMDLKIPNVNVFDYLKKFRLLKLPVIILTAETREDFVKQAIEEGVIDFISKTEFDSTNFLNRVMRNVRKHAAKEIKVNIAEAKNKPGGKDGVNGQKEDKYKSEAERERDRKIDAMIDKINDVKVLSQSIKGMQNILSQEGLSLHDMFKEVCQDAAFSAKVVKVANSPMYRLKTPAKTLEQAIVNIGRVGLESLISGVGFIDDVISGAGIKDKINRREVCRHSLACGVIARHVSQQAKFIDSDIAFLIGLLHDIGKFFFEDNSAKVYHKILEMAIERKVELDVVEKEVLGIDHAEFGARVFTKWGFQEDLVAAIGCHHYTYDEILKFEGTDRLLIGVISIANRLANILPMSIQGTEILDFVENKYINFIGIRQADDLDKVLLNIKKEVEELENILLPKPNVDNKEAVFDKAITLNIFGSESLTVDPIYLRYKMLCRVEKGIEEKLSVKSIIVYYILKQNEVDKAVEEIKLIKKDHNFNGNVIIVTNKHVTNTSLLQSIKNTFVYQLPMLTSNFDKIIFK